MKKKFLPIFIIVFIIVVLAVVVFASNTKTLTCNYSEGGVTLLYTKKKLISFRTTGKLSYDLKSQNSYASKVGIDEYIDDLVEWFATETDGGCKRSE